MAPIGSVLKNTLVYIVVVSIFVYIGVRFLLFIGLQALLLFVDGGRTDSSLENTAWLGIGGGLLVILIGFGLALNMSLPSIVGDEMIEF